MNKFWKISSAAGLILGTLCLLVLFRYSATKSVVITEEHDLQGEGNLAQLGQTILQEKTKYEFIVLVNSAHGGENQGNRVGELQEKEVTLQVGKALEEMSVEGKIGIFLIRQEDMDVSNESRAELIAEVEPDLVLDLHVNADPANERTLGTAVVYNARFYMDRLSNVKLADIIERSLVTEIAGKALGVFEDAEEQYPLLGMVQVPAVSIEMGYLTNKQEADLLSRESYQKKIAQGIYNGILEAREEMNIE